MRAPRSPRRAAFTLIELLVVMVLIGVLAALLLPAIQGAIRTSRDAAVGADLNTLAQALASFKEKYGDYPPSRVLLAENGHYPPTLLAGDMVPSANGTGSSDVTMAALGQRSMSYLRKFWPRLIFSTSTSPPATITTTNWYDYNGNGVYDPTPYVLEGDECLTFFLGGIPLNTGTATDPAWSMSGFGKSPINPFSNNLANGNAMYSGNRTPPHFEFKNDRLKDPDDPATDNVRFPSYFDTLATAAPIAYFSAYGGDHYDPNDCNMPERDDAGAAILRLFRVASPTVDSSGTSANQLTFSAPPNPYTAGDPAPMAPRPLSVQWQKGQSFQLISAGRDGLYGHGGIHATAATIKLPTNPTAEVRPATGMDRSREADNIVNFAGGPLGN